MVIREDESTWQKSIALKPGDGAFFRSKDLPHKVTKYYGGIRNSIVFFTHDVMLNNWDYDNPEYCFQVKQKSDEDFNQDTSDDSEDFDIDQLYDSSEEEEDAHLSE